MRRLALPCLALLLLPLALGACLASPAAAQERRDQSRLSFGVGLGYNGGTDLWTIKDQGIFDVFAVDSATLGRTVRPTIGVTFLGVYYPNDRWGFSGEAHLIGLAYEDHCRLTTASGSTFNQQICTGLNGKASPGTAVAMTAGGIFRPFPFIGMQPYVRANLGFIFSEQSAIQMSTAYPSAPDSFYTVYTDHHPGSVTPTAAFAAGATGFVGRSYQIRVEAKDNFIDVKRVTGTTVTQGFEPAWKRRFSHVWTLSVGFEVVLEKRRGRRY